MDPRLQLILLLTDKIFTIIQHMQEVSDMEEEKVLKEIEVERLEKDALVNNVTL